MKAWLCVLFLMVCTPCFAEDEVSDPNPNSWYNQQLKLNHEKEEMTNDEWREKERNDPDSGINAQEMCVQERLQCLALRLPDPGDQRWPGEYKFYQTECKLAENRCRRANYTYHQNEDGVNGIWLEPL